MVYLVTHSNYPSHMAAAVGKRYLEMLQKFPPDPSLSQTVVPAALKRTDYGIKGITISEVKEGKLDEALKRSMNQLSMFNDLEGVEISLEVYATASEALATVGMKMPE
ncbi:MAG: hypothetical protein ACFFD2_23515 [Promethearchaeota archaeon]